MAAAAALGVLTVLVLLVRAQTFSNGVDGFFSANNRYAKLDKFLHDRIGLVGNRSKTLMLTTDRSFLIRTSTSTTEPLENNNESNDENDEDNDDDDDDDDEEEEDDELTQKVVRLRHWNRWDGDNTLFDKNVQKHEPAKTMSTISENKWKLLGSRKTVEETFRNSHRISIQQGVNDGNEAYKHQMRIAKEALCKVPRPRVIKASDIYPSSNKRYIPSCTVLHVCADDTGCCGSPLLKCGPKSTQPLHLQFLVYTEPGLGDRHASDRQTYQKSLLFYNHTECECQSKIEEMMPRDTITTSLSSDNHCKCPTEYTVRYLANGSCSCDCFDKQRECIRYKKGNLYFNHLDRYCITSGQCLLPMCEYGVYSHRTGRCPKKYENQYSLKKKHYF
ncbi:uncharacterized protein LOC126896201 isoform X2 [Daktulosphaira vitifoliae]|uniref:uncharacterized protein LOC126896201 isoform X2 n=1 Tax=Daktulosphaira vitifoliae TaxID=58002 RepID=UPI0021A99673|nr:uncharacterized protein LOC126896201 isoform X2 [Daktulosphaira vitifoliae]